MGAAVLAIDAPFLGMGAAVLAIDAPFLGMNAGDAPGAVVIGRMARPKRGIRPSLASTRLAIETRGARIRRKRAALRPMPTRMSWMPVPLLRRRSPLSPMRVPIQRTDGPMSVMGLVIPRTHAPLLGIREPPQRTRKSVSHMAASVPKGRAPMAPPNRAALDPGSVPH